MDSVGEGEGEMIWENGIETCKISCSILVSTCSNTRICSCATVTLDISLGELERDFQYSCRLKHFSGANDKENGFLNFGSLYPVCEVF